MARGLRPTVMAMVNNMNDLRSVLEQLAAELGFTRVGIIDPADAIPLPNVPQRAHGFEARSIAVLIMPSHRASWDSDQAETAGFYFTSNKAHVNIHTWIERVRETGVEAERLGAVRAKAAAARAGLGIVRRNTLLYTPECGSYHTIQVVALSAPLAADPPYTQKPGCNYDEDACAGCGRCVAACPTGALDGQGGIDREKCLRSHMMSGKPTPAAMRHLIGRKLMGCEACQWTCPRQADVETRGYSALDVFRVANLLEPSAEALESLTGFIGANYARRARVMAQAALIAGNMASLEYLPALDRLCVSEDEAIREHAAWARDRIIYRTEASRCFA